LVPLTDLYMTSHYPGLANFFFNRFAKVNYFPEFKITRIYGIIDPLYKYIWTSLRHGFIDNPFYTQSVS